MTLETAITSLGLIASVTVLWQIATMQALSTLQPEEHGNSDRPKPDTIPAKRPSPYGLT